MTKQTSELRGVIVREGGLFVLIVTFDAKFFSLLFALYIMKPDVGLVMGEKRGGFLGCTEKKNKDGTT